jgi:hypothetical protein
MTGIPLRNLVEDWGGFEDFVAKLHGQGSGLVWSWLNQTASR